MREYLRRLRDKEIPFKRVSCDGCNGVDLGGIVDLGGKCHMAEINLREVEKDFVNALKMKALQSGETLRGYCIRVLTASIEGLDAIPPKDQTGIPPKPGRGSRAHAAPIQSNIGHGVNCRCFACKPVKVRALE